MVSLYKALHKTFMKSSLLPLSVCEFAEQIVCPAERLDQDHLLSVEAFLQNTEDWN